MRNSIVSPISGHFVPVNYPPGKTGTGEECPFFKLLCEGAHLLGTSEKEMAEDPRFCTRWEDVSFSGPKTEVPSELPRCLPTVCARIWYEMVFKVQAIEYALKHPVKLDARSRIVIRAKPENLESAVLHTKRSLTGKEEIGKLLSVLTDEDKCCSLDEALGRLHSVADEIGSKVHGFTNQEHAINLFSLMPNRFGSIKEGCPIKPEAIISGVDH